MSRVISILAVVIALLLLAGCPSNTQKPEPKLYSAKDHPGYAPEKKGEVKTVTIDGNEFSFEVIDGLAIYQGDIILGNASDVENNIIPSANLEPAGIICDRTLLGLIGCDRWENGVVPFSFKNDWGNDNATMRQRIRDAIGVWETNTNFRFQEQASGGVEFKNSTGCSAMVGRWALGQSVNLSIDCDVTAVIHEIGHAIGLFHEQSRSDRAQFVSLLSANIEPGKEHNFNREDWAAGDVGPYDYSSIMHYSCFAFSVNGNPTLQPTTPGVTCNMLGNFQLSDGDILSAYTSVPPVFSISGITSGAIVSRDQTLNLRISTPDPILARFLKWHLNGSASPLGTGPTQTLRASTLTNGANTITLKMIISGVLVAEHSVSFSVGTNTPPTITLSIPGNPTTVNLNRSFTVNASISDDEGSPCSTCTITWSPTPEFGSSTSVNYRFSSVGSQTIQATARDSLGATTTATITINVVNAPPTAQIDQPIAGQSFVVDTLFTLSGYGLDINEGPGPGPGRISSCSWSIDGGAFTDDPTCNSPTSISTVGSHTITMRVLDSQGLSTETSVNVEITSAPTNFPPTVSISSPDAGSTFNNTQTITLTGSATDPESNTPITYRWLATPLDNSGTSLTESVELAFSSSASWIPDTKPVLFSSGACFSFPGQRIRLTLEATDSLGSIGTSNREILVLCPPG